MSYRRPEALANAMGIAEITEPEQLLPPAESLSAERVQQEFIILFCDSTRWQYKYLCKAQAGLVSETTEIFPDEQGGFTEITQRHPEGVYLANGSQLHMIREEERVFGPPEEQGDVTVPLATHITYTLQRSTSEGTEIVSRFRGEFCNKNETPQVVHVSGDNMWGPSILAFSEDGSLPTSPSKDIFLQEMDRYVDTLREIQAVLNQDPSFHAIDPGWPHSLLADAAFLEGLGIIDPDNPGH